MNLDTVITHTSVILLRAREVTGKKKLSVDYNKQNNVGKFPCLKLCGLDNILAKI